MKIIALNGSPRVRGRGYKYLQFFKESINRNQGIDFNIINLADYRIEQCKGCMICYEKGEESCPQKDDYIALIRTLLDSDAVIFYTPTYTLSVSGMIKNFFDRSSYLFHRPLFKGKYSLILSCAAVFGEGYALRTLTLLSEGVGFRVLGKIGIKNYSYDLKPAYELRIKSLIRKKMPEACFKIKKK